ncbi:protein BatD [Kangiella sp. HD9-110m-PIT-SAG07]|nr:protein BatD [Kangiella sp. HD9-110m-PIT-SAG07]
MKQQKIVYSLLIMLLLAVAPAASAKITLSLDRTDIHENETFHLRVQVEEVNTLNAGANMDFIPEEITVRSRQEYNSSIVVNGQYNTQMGWDFELLANSPGTYTIPALSIGNERSEAFTIRIFPEQDDIGDSSNAQIKLRAKLSKEEVYVQQQLIFTVRIYRSVVARNQKITPVRVTNALVEQLGDNKTFDVVKDGNNFRVVEQRYAIFPQQSGEMTIEPITYSATVLEENQGRSPWQRSQLKPINLSTQKYRINVKPKPQNAAEPWLPATKLQLEAEWQPKNQTFRVGDPAHLDFIIKGTGLLKTQLPTVAFPDQKGITIYRDTPQYRQRINRFGVNSYHFEKIAIIPSEPGSITIPEVKIPWWNVETDQQEFATLPSRTIRVEQSSNQISSSQTQTVIPKDQQMAMQQDNQAFPENSESNTTVNDINQDYWKYITFGLAALWLLTALLLVRQRKNKHRMADTHHTDAQVKAHSPANAIGLKHAINAANNNDAHLTAQSLASWLRSDESPAAATNITQFIGLCRDSGLSELSDELELLQHHCYSRHADDISSTRRWRGRKMARLLAGYKSPNPHKNEQKLPELYRRRH